PHHGAYVPVYIPGEQHQHGLPQPDIRDDFHAVEGLRDMTGIVECLEDHHADQSPEELRAETCQRRHSVLHQHAKASAQDRSIGAHVSSCPYNRATISSIGGFSTNRSRMAWRAVILLISAAVET